MFKRITQVPLEEDRRYLKDQRLKTGPKGNYQLATVDRVGERRRARAQAVGESQAALLKAHQQEKEVSNFVLDMFEAPGSTVTSSAEVKLIYLP